MNADEIFVVSQSALDASCQTETHPCIDSPNPGPPQLIATGPALLREYRENISYFLDMADQSSVSSMRSEVMNCVREHKIFQERLFGQSSPPITQLPPNAFHEFTVSLHLALFHDRFVMTSSIPGFELAGGAHDIELLLSYVRAGVLPPRTLETLRKVNLVWYDGGLICEVNDNRVSPPAFVRVHLLANPEDIGSVGFEAEQEFLFARFPSLCLENTPQVARVARVATLERCRWQRRPGSETPAAFLQRRVPQMFIEGILGEQKEPEEPQKPAEEDLDRVREKLEKQFGVAGKS